MREYELTVLIHPDLEMNLEPATDKIKALIEGNGGKITKEANEGKSASLIRLKVRISRFITITNWNFLQLRQRRFLRCSTSPTKLSATC